jgi:hypothetical protein
MTHKEVQEQGLIKWQKIYDALNEVEKMLRSECSYCENYKGDFTCNKCPLYTAEICNCHYGPEEEDFWFWKLDDSVKDAMIRAYHIKQFIETNHLEDDDE